MRSTPSILSTFVLLALTACGGSESEESSATPGSMAEAMNAATQALEGLSGMPGMPGSGPSRVVAPEELRDRMPETVAGLPRVDLSVTSSGVPGMTMTAVQARYQGEGGREVEIAIADLGAVPGGAMAGAAWSLAEFDRTTSNGYERTTRFEGFRALESEDRTGGGHAVSLNVMAGSFLVQLTGQGVEMSVLHDVARQLNLPELGG